MVCRNGQSFLPVKMPASYTEAQVKFLHSASNPLSLCLGKQQMSHALRPLSPIRDQDGDFGPCPGPPLSNEAIWVAEAQAFDLTSVVFSGILAGRWPGKRTAPMVSWCHRQHLNYEPQPSPSKISNYTVQIEFTY